MAESGVDPASPISDDMINKLRKCWMASTADNNLTLYGFRQFKTTHLLNLRLLDDEIAEMDHIVYQAGLSLGLSPSSTDRPGLKHGKRDANAPNIGDTITKEFISKLRDLIRQYGVYQYLPWNEALGAFNNIMTMETFSLLDDEKRSSLRDDLSLDTIPDGPIPALGPQILASIGETGNVNAGQLTGSMFKTFPNIRMAVLVGIGGGIPRSTPSEDPLDDVHLGDVVVGWPGDGKPACVYHDRGRSKAGGQFELVGTMQNPDWRLLQALGILASDQEIGKTTFADQLRRLQKQKRFAQKFARPGLEHDRLFKATDHHVGDYGSDCAGCDRKELVQRPQRSADDAHELVFHRGTIATGNAVVQDGELRDEIGARCDGALCVEMEATGVDANRRCLIIRGTSDYAGSHKDDV